MNRSILCDGSVRKFLTHRTRRLHVAHLSGYRDKDMDIFVNFLVSHPGLTTLELEFSYMLQSPFRCLAGIFRALRPLKDVRVSKAVSIFVWAKLYFDSTYSVVYTVKRAGHLPPGSIELFQFARALERRMLGRSIHDEDPVITAVMDSNEPLKARIFYCEKCDCGCLDTYLADQATTKVSAPLF